VWLCEGEVEQGKFLLAADEFFLSLASAMSQGKFVEVGFAFTKRGKLGKGAAT